VKNGVSLHTPEQQSEPEKQNLPFALKVQAPELLAADSSGLLVLAWDWKEPKPPNAVCPPLPELPRKRPEGKVLLPEEPLFDEPPRLKRLRDPPLELELPPTGNPPPELLLVELNPGKRPI
jgi:hypothetical protein